MFNFSSKAKTSVLTTVDPVEDSGVLRRVVILSLNLILFLGLSFFLYRLVYADGIDSRIDQVLVLVLGVVWSCVLLISGLVLGLSEFLLLVVFGLAAVFFPFLKYLNLVLLSLFVGLVFATLVLMRQASRNAADNSLKFKPSLILSSSLTKIFFVLSLLAALVFWSEKFSGGLNLEPSDIDSILAPGLDLVFPNYDTKTTFGELADKMIGKQNLGVLGILLPNGISTTALTNTIKLQARDNFLSQLSQLFGRKVSAKDSISTMLHSLISNYYQSLSETLKKIIDFSILFVLFIFWFGIFQLFSIVFHAIFWLVLQLLLGLKIIKIDFISVEKEVITL